MTVTTWRAGRRTGEGERREDGGRANASMPLARTHPHHHHSTTTRGLAVLTTRLAAWHAASTASTPDPPPWLARARALTRAGVPITLRGRVWRAFLGLDGLAVAGEYERLCVDMEASDAASGDAGGDDDDPTPTDAARASRRAAWAAASASWDAQIDKDVPRTLAGHPTLAPPTKRAALRRVLRAFARRCPSTGYTQGLNLVAATLLLFLGETDAFWGLTVVVADVLPDYHGSRLASALRDARAITAAARTHLPSLAASLDSVGVDVAPVAVRWLLSGYVGCLPLETAVRVWDAALCERTPAVLLRVGVALLDVYGRALAAAADGADVLALLRDAPALTYDGSRLLDAACAGHGWLGGDALEQLRQEVEEAEHAEQEGSATAPPLRRPSSPLPPEPPTPAAAAARAPSTPLDDAAPAWSGGAAEFSAAGLAHAAAAGEARVSPARGGGRAPTRPRRPPSIVKGAAHPPRYDPPPAHRSTLSAAAAAALLQIARPRGKQGVPAPMSTLPRAYTAAGARLAAVASDLATEAAAAASRAAEATAIATADAVGADAAKADAAKAKTAADTAVVAAAAAAQAAAAARADAATARADADAAVAEVDAARRGLAARRTLLAEKEAVIADVAARVARARAAAGGEGGGRGWVARLVRGRG